MSHNKLSASPCRLADGPADLKAAVSGWIEVLRRKPPTVHRDIKRLCVSMSPIPDGTRDEIAADRLIFGTFRRTAAQ